MIGLYKARNGDLIKIDGISEYFLFGNNVTILSGIVNDEIGAWDEFGNYKINQVLGIQDTHNLDIVEFIGDNEDSVVVK